jgi:hypothetical protein
MKRDLASKLMFARSLSSTSDLSIVALQGLRRRVYIQRVKILEYLSVVLRGRALVK